MRHFVLLRAAMGAWCIGAATVCAYGGPLLLVLNKGNNTLATVDAVTYEIKGRVPSGPDPHEVIASADGKLAFITNYQQGNGAASTLSVVDLAGQKALAPVDLGALLRPHGLTLSGGKVYFTAEGSKVIGRYDPSAGKVDWVMGTGQNRTHMVIVAKDGKLIFTSNVASASISFLEQVEGGGRGPGGPPPPGRGDGRGPGGPPAGRGPGRGPMPPDWNVTTVAVGRGAEGFDLSPDGKELWAANAQDASVSILDVAAKKVTATIPVPFHAANRLKFTPDGKLALISDLSGNELFVMNTATRAVVKRIDLGGGAAGIEMDPSGKRAFVSVGSMNSVAVIDLSELKLTRRIEAGPGPDGLAWVQ